MDYISYLQGLDSCHFCRMEDEFIVCRGKLFYVLLARAPYVENHLLIVSHRHFANFDAMTEEEYLELGKFIKMCNTFLYNQGYEDLSLFVRDGNIGGTSGKSVTHFHYHVLPGVDVRGVIVDPRNREFFDDATFASMTQKTKKLWNTYFSLS